MSDLRNKIVREARRYLGSKYGHAGRSKDLIDCIGLVAVVGRDVVTPATGITIEDMPAYSPYGTGTRLDDEFARRGFVSVSINNVQPGDILLFWVKNPQIPRHVALKTPEGMIHTHQGIGRVVEHSIDERWAKRLWGARRFPGVE